MVERYAQIALLDCMPFSQAGSAHSQIAAIHTRRPAKIDLRLGVRTGQCGQAHEIGDEV